MRSRLSSKLAAVPPTVPTIARPPVLRPLSSLFTHSQAGRLQINLQFRSYSNMSPQSDIRNLHLDPQTFNQALYTRILKHWFTSYPISHPTPSLDDLKSWFGTGATPAEKAAFDASCRDIALPALTALGPDSVALPPFESYEADIKLYPTFAKPLLSQFDDKSLKPDANEREEAALALGLLLDQFPRNCFRDEDQKIVFLHYDRISRAVSRAASEAGYDRVSRWAAMPVWRMWFDMPLLHSEYLPDHVQLQRNREDLLRLIKEKGDEQSAMFVERMMADKSHSGALERFGRYPWRNKALGRENTKEEQEFLDNGGGPFAESS